MIRAVLILLAMCAPAVARPLDNGGYIHDYVHRIIAASGQRHEIRGDCVSACTMWLGHKGTCVYPDATLWFHSSGDPRGDAALRAFYPPRVLAFVERNGLLASRQLRGVPGWQLIRLGVERC